MSASRGLRRSSATELDTKSARVTVGWNSLNQEQDLEEQQQDIACIMTALMKCPKKIKGCKRAVLSDMFLGDDEISQNPQNFFAESTKYMWKIPKPDALDYMRRRYKGFSVQNFQRWAATDKHLP